MAPWRGEDLTGDPVELAEPHTRGGRCPHRGEPVRHHGPCGARRVQLARGPQFDHVAILPGRPMPGSLYPVPLHGRGRPPLSPPNPGPRASPRCAAARRRGTRRSPAEIAAVSGSASPAPPSPPPGPPQDRDRACAHDDVLHVAALAHALDVPLDGLVAAIASSADDARSPRIGRTWLKSSAAATSTVVSAPPPGTARRTMQERSPPLVLRRAAEADGVVLQPVPLDQQQVRVRALHAPRQRQAAEARHRRDDVLRLGEGDVRSRPPAGRPAAARAPGSCPHPTKTRA